MLKSYPSLVLKGVKKKETLEFGVINCLMYPNFFFFFLYFKMSVNDQMLIILLNLILEDTEFILEKVDCSFLTTGWRTSVTSFHLTLRI